MSERFEQRGLIIGDEVWILGEMAIGEKSYDLFDVKGAESAPNAALRVAKATPNGTQTDEENGG